jgi:putative hemolysin
LTVLLVLLIAGIIIAAFAALAETTLTSVSRIRMRSLAEQGDRRAKIVVRLHNDPNAYLSTILSLNTTAVIVASTATAILIDQYLHTIPQVVGAIVLSLFVLIFCEIAPKSLALRFNESLALRLARPVALITMLLRPLVGGLTAFSRLLVRAATPGRNVRGPYVTEDELIMLVQMGAQEGVVEQEERQMIAGILEMTDKSVHEVMVPRVDVVAADVTRSVADIIQIVMDSGHSRIPIYEENIDNVVGVIYAKDLLRQGVRSDEKRPLRELVREPFFTPETKHVGELLSEMKRKVHIAIVIDEHGGTAGIVTFEDLMEEIVGPIRDEYDTGEPEEVQFLSESEVLLNGRYPIDDIKDLLDIDLGEVEADSVGGLVYERLGEIPKVGAKVQLGDATLIVEEVRRQRIQLVRITSPRPFLQDNSSRDGQATEQPLTPADVDRAAH